ncbi:putative serine/threonine-protein kinase-like protein CCR3 [Silene latifolia]|uniref:putative serine/threonine-protein kinase-like protein CCR3 n=1 Tax=Silene latifolia TaxID=37657 RepID=UPI003D771A9C
MRITSIYVSCFVNNVVFLAVFSLLTKVTGLGSSSTIAVTYGSNSVCRILVENSSQSIQCFQGDRTFSVLPNISFDRLAGGKNMFCGLTSDGADIFCWDNLTSRVENIYHNPLSTLTDLTVGNDRVCALQAKTSIIQCWKRGFSGRPVFLQPEGETAFLSITSGDGFSCGIAREDKTVLCWGENGIGDSIEAQFWNMSMLSVVAGKSHVCGISVSGILICKGKNDAGQLNIPSVSNTPFYYSALALGGAYTCGLTRSNGSVVCWGRGGVAGNVPAVSFVSIVGALDFTCGLRTDNFTILCWGSGWSVIPGPLQVGRRMGSRVKYSEFAGPGISPMPSPVSVSLPLAEKDYRPFWAYEVFGIVGMLSGFCALCYFIYLRKTRSREKTVKEVVKAKELTSIGSKSSVDYSPFIESNPSSAPQSRSSSITQLSSLASGRERNWENAFKHVEKAEVFTLTELARATRNFSLENKIGRGSFGTVYRGKLPDNREVAVKREIICRTKEREYAFESELTLLSRVHHKHLVSLVGFCEENSERLLVYEFMANGALHDMLHNSPRNENACLDSWKIRIKIALDAARGIEYLHNYAVPPIIHRDIKTSNILLDGNWVGRVSDFGLSLKGPESEEGSMSIKAVGTVGYIDPEYYLLKVLTTKSDVYGFGVVLLELLTGKKALFKESEGNGPTGVVEYAGPFIVAGEVRKVLDKRVVQPVMNEAEAVELVAYTAMMCVNLEGKERPTMSDVVSNLERALALCTGSSGTFSPNFYSFN